MTRPTPKYVISQIINRHVDPKETVVFLFGSRTAGTSLPTSDYDVGLFTHGRIPLSTIGQIKEEIEESSVPVHVDVVDFSTVSNRFRKLALRKIKLWNKPSKNLKQTWLSFKKR